MACASNRITDGRKLSIVLVGALSAGKSTTGNFLLGGDRFPENSGTDQAPPVIQIEETEKWDVVDTPGLGQGPDTVHDVMQEITAQFASKKCVALYVSQDHRHVAAHVYQRLAALRELLPGMPFVLVKTGIPRDKRRRQDASNSAYVDWLNDQWKAMETGVKGIFEERGDSIASVFKCAVGVHHECEDNTAPWHPSELVALMDKFTREGLVWPQSANLLTWDQLRTGTFSYGDFLRNAQEQAEAQSKLEAQKRWFRCMQVPKKMLGGAVLIGGSLLSLTAEASAMCSGVETFGAIFMSGVGTSVAAAKATEGGIDRALGVSKAKTNADYYASKLAELKKVGDDAEEEEKQKQAFQKRILGMLV